MKITVKSDDGVDLILSAAEIMRAYWLLIDARLLEILKSKK